MVTSLEQLNTAPLGEALRMLDGVYEHSRWIAEKALQERPFRTLAQLKHALIRVVEASGRQAQLALIQAHPELAGTVRLEQAMSSESAREQYRTGLKHCSPDELAKLQRLNEAYRDKFGFPFILAVGGPRGTGLGRQEIIETMERRLQGHAGFEFSECLRQIHRIAELRLNEKFGFTPVLGNLVWDWLEDLAQYSDAGYKERGQLTVTYLTPAHRACAHSISMHMHSCGFDEVHIDAVGNVVGRYRANRAGAPILLTGSHYDTVLNGGKYDGRLGIFVPLVCVQELSHQQKRLPFDLEVVAFAEEEGQRYKATFLGSSALTGEFNYNWLEQRDIDRISMRDAMQHAGFHIEDITLIKRNPEHYLGFLEVHIEQGPVLNELNLPLGIVSSIKGSVRLVGTILGTACHAGTTPMNRRRDAAMAVAEFMLYLEERAARHTDALGTVGTLRIPDGSVNVVPGCCEFSLDLRAPSDRQRDALLADVQAELQAICERRGVQFKLSETMRASAAPSAPALQQRWEAAVQALGVPLHRLPSGAGHDAMKIHTIMPQAMLFVRGQNSGISHNPLESTTSDDIALAIDAFSRVLDQLASEY
ncbi:MAG: 2-oxo-4-hydroxy-4-carboxy-5-ureidoimidazoline decarboxylase [Rhodoferax sp.]|nr:2-oxo-4-hydroxy-4-carboxy-5-ureidoimidazoline decarboxylase [Rhodoferax sp.]MBP9685312.1 2-oxo-4-hydroxy-4-carboxy-5-ureidoimidazoline decarboxylase [Rhodoferax sp.]